MSDKNPKKKMKSARPSPKAEPAAPTESGKAKQADPKKGAKR